MMLALLILLQSDPDGVAFFESKIRPVLIEKCYSCHAADAKKIKGGLVVDTREGLLRGGDTGPAVVPGDVEKSLLVKAVRWTDDDLQMPPKNPLPKEVIADFEAWVKRGAPDPRTGAAKAAKPAIDIGKARERWAYRPLPAVTPPAVKNEDWVKTPIDRFVLAKLEAAGIAPNGPAENRRLVRRAALDLTGLPPDDVSIPYEQAVDKFLASPRHGERWARFWLDAARFAESHGFEQDYDREGAFYYRDFVIRALNDDLPYDRFVQWQVAGDELAPDEPLAWMATGFLGAGAFPTQLTENEFEPARYDELDSMGSTVGSAMLGLSVGCARCHDHKFDPLPAKDYYRFVATFTGTIRAHKEFDLDPDAHRRAVSAWEQARAPLAKALDDAVAAWLAKQTPAPEGARDKAVKSDPEAKKAAKALSDYDAKKPKLPKVLVTTEGLKPLKHHADDRGFPHFYKETHVLARGDVNKKQGVADPGFLQILSRAPESRWPAAPGRTPGRRAALAKWLTDVDAGAGALLARVAVNRLWHHHFGRGLVATPNDFGAQGEAPTHPELIDWLAGELIRTGWRLKPIHKLILTSAVYRQGTDFDPVRAKVDPDNKLIWRRSARRLEAEAIRDSMLAVSGLLDATMYGPGTLNEGMNRRSIYFFQKRSALIPTMMLFDAPEPLVSQGSRPSTVIAPQALHVMNSPHVRRYAAGLAKRLAADDPVGSGFRLALGREPTADERAKCGAYLKASSPTDFAQILLSMSEFIYVD
jgi:hypothetical protein